MGHKNAFRASHRKSANEWNAKAKVSLIRTQSAVTERRLKVRYRWLLFKEDHFSKHTQNQSQEKWSNWWRPTPTWFEVNKAGPIGAGSLREDDYLRPFSPGGRTALDFPDGALPWARVLPRNEHRLGELRKGCKFQSQTAQEQDGSDLLRSPSAWLVSTSFNKIC